MTCNIPVRLILFGAGSVSLLSEYVTMYFSMFSDGLTDSLCVLPVVDTAVTHRGVGRESLSSTLISPIQFSLGVGLLCRVEVLLSASSLTIICVSGSEVARVDSLTASVLSFLYSGPNDPTQAPWLAQTMFTF